MRLYRLFLVLTTWTLSLSYLVSLRRSLARLYNDEIMDFVDKKAEIIGFGEEDSIGKPINTMEIDMIVTEKRELTWENGDSKIGYGDHDLIKVVTVDESGMRFCLKKANITMLHNVDQATFRIGIEIRGKLDNDPIVPKRCCITFSIRKDVLEDKRGKRVWWAIILPTLVEGDCDYAITMSAEEFLQIMKKKPGSFQ